MLVVAALLIIPVLTGFLRRWIVLIEWSGSVFTRQNCCSLSTSHTAGDGRRQRPWARLKFLLMEGAPESGTRSAPQEAWWQGWGEADQWLDISAGALWAPSVGTQVQLQSKTKEKHIPTCLKAHTSVHTACSFLTLLLSLSKSCFDFQRSSVGFTQSIKEPTSPQGWNRSMCRLIKLCHATFCVRSLETIVCVVTMETKLPVSQSRRILYLCWIKPRTSSNLKLWWK